MITNNGIKILIGDFNLKMDEENMYRPTIGQDSLRDISNDNGIRLIHLCLAKGLNLSSTYFPRKSIYKQNWITSNSITKNLIDQVISTLFPKRITQRTS